MPRDTAKLTRYMRARRDRLPQPVLSPAALGELRRLVARPTLSSVGYARNAYPAVMRVLCDEQVRRAERAGHEDAFEVFPIHVMDASNRWGASSETDWWETGKRLHESIMPGWMLYSGRRRVRFYEEGLWPTSLLILDETPVIDPTPLVEACTSRETTLVLVAEGRGLERYAPRLMWRHVDDLAVGERERA